METKQENVIPTDYAEVMQKSYIDYAMSVIISRALPDVRDGLKPVQRRTLYDMYELGIRYDRPYRKCARIVGDTMGKYHPHGDSSIYEALVVMAQDFKKGKTLVDGHGNFGSIEGDGAAAMRYTEARLEKLTQDVFLEDLDNLDFKIFRFEKMDTCYNDLSEQEKTEERTNILNGLNFARKVIATGECDFLLLDEILGLMDKGIAPVETIIDMLKQKDESMHIIMTGRWLPDALKPYVDSITTITTELTDQERE